MTGEDKVFAAKKVVLCIDDDETGLALRKLMLEAEGYEVFTATSGDEGLALLRSLQAHMVILDYKMPGMNGAEVAQLIRSERTDLPIVLLSGYVDDVPAPALSLVNALVTKGGSPGELLRIVEKEMGGSSSGRVTILNVDDNDGQRYAISRVLKNAGFNVIEARTGREALDLAGFRPSLVILDINLPDMLGFDVCRELKTRPITRDIPVIHISATYPGLLACNESANSGATRFIEHPRDLVEVLEVVRLELQRNQLVREQSQRGESA